jgi:hypothetical protein
MDEHGKDEWVARWQIGSKPRKVAEKVASRSYCRLKLPEIKPAKNGKSTENVEQKQVNNKNKSQQVNYNKKSTNNKIDKIK